jgi:site-specific recombinase XerD
MNDLDSHLRQRGLMKSTRKTYASLAAQGGDDPVGWLKGLVDSRRPVGTLAPARAAVRHRLEAEGKSEAEIQALLPRTRGRKSRVRESLSADALARYYEAVEAHAAGPIRTILLLLPRSGLRISEACALRHEDVIERDGRVLLKVLGKGDKPRIVPLGEAGSRLLSGYSDTAQGRRDPVWLFPGRGGSITTSAVRKVTRAIRAAVPGFTELSPHVLRHTYATSLLAEGVDVRSLQALLGHEAISTTMRYLHPSTDDLVRSVGRIEGM